MGKCSNSNAKTEEVPDNGKDMEELAKQTGGTKGAVSTKDRSPEAQMALCNG